MKIYRIKKFQLKDKKFIFNLYNQSIIEKNFYRDKIVNFIEHKKWLNINLKNKKIIIFILYQSKKKIGYSRFNKQVKGNYLISIALKKAFRNKGLGSKLLGLSIDKFYKSNSGNLYAYIKNINTKSINAFKKNNFVKISKKEFFKKTKKKIISRNFNFFQRVL